MPLSTRKMHQSNRRLRSGIDLSSLLVQLKVHEKYIGKRPTNIFFSQTSIALTRK